MDLQPLLRPDGRAEDVVVGGARVGQPAAGLQGGPWQNAFDSSPGAPDDGDGVETPFYHDGVDPRDNAPAAVAERVVRAIEGTGTLTGDGLTVRIEQGVIRHLIVHGKRLEALRLRHQGDVPMRLGVPEAKAYRWPWIEYHYPARGIVLSWDASDNRPFVLKLGEDDYCEPQLGARDLLAEMVQASEVMLRREWRSSPGSGSANGLRYERMIALARALGVGALESIANGTFLHDAEPELYRPLMGALISRYLPNAAPTLEADWTDLSVMPIVFASLFRYRCQAQPLMEVGRGWLHFGPPVHAMLCALGDVNKTLNEQLAPLDAWLARAIDPLQRTFTRRTLMEHFDYPEVDPLWLEHQQLWD